MRPVSLHNHQCDIPGTEGCACGLPLLRHVHPLFARGLAIGEPLLEGERAGVSFTAQNESESWCAIRKTSFSRGRFIYRRRAAKPGLRLLGEAVMRNALEKGVPPLREDAERPVLNAMLRKHKQPCLLQHCDGRLRDLVERGNRLGIGRVSLLRHDQLGELGSDIHVGLLYRATNYGAPPASSGNAHHGRTRGGARLIIVVTNVDKSLIIGEGSHGNLPQRSVCPLEKVPLMVPSGCTA